MKHHLRTLIFPFYRNCYLYLYLPYCGPFCLSDGESFRYGKGLDNEKRRSVVSLMGLVMDLGLHTPQEWPGLLRPSVVRVFCQFLSWNLGDLRWAVVSIGLPPGILRVGSIHPEHIESARSWAGLYWVGQSCLAVFWGLGGCLVGVLGWFKGACHFTMWHRSVTPRSDFKTPIA